VLSTGLLPGGQSLYAWPFLAEFVAANVKYE